ncbi:LolA family protein [Iningainema tapete]|uniref:Uncharacterized protein n=1 Tax=Iningainema tapete BLCC-T55 TaxID=2748662 RepID=A0A8J6XGQ1_9CYAN|nr:hypothetical protein [Iningainema tapete]MBD2771484.1 hypothetical protein [Iningainema tapete BLCC-T55]
MKRTFISITVLSIIALLTGSVNATPVSRQVQQASLGQINTSISSQATEQLDLPLLVKTSTAFFQSDRYQTESQMLIQGGNQGAQFNAYAQIKTIVQSNRKFRAEIAFTSPGEKPKQSALIISDGKQVSIYRPDLRKYAVTSYEAFDQSDDSFLIGLSSSFFLVMPEDTRQIIASGVLSKNNVLQEMGLADNQQFKGDKSTVEGEAFYVYNYTEPKDGFTFRAFVQPETAILKQLQLVSKSEGLDVVVTEKIVQRNQNPTVTAQTFKFTPPQNAIRVKSLSISPF